MGKQSRVRGEASTLALQSMTRVCASEQSACASKHFQNVSCNRASADEHSACASEHRACSTLHTHDAAWQTLCALAEPHTESSSFWEDALLCSSAHDMCSREESGVVRGLHRSSAGFPIESSGLPTHSASFPSQSTGSLRFDARLRRARARLPSFSTRGLSEVDSPTQLLSCSSPHEVRNHTETDRKAGGDLEATVEGARRRGVTGLARSCRTRVLQGDRVGAVEESRR